jgi:integrase
MPRKATGSIRYRRGRWEAVVTLSSTERPIYALDAFTDEADKDGARQRADVLAEIAVCLRAGGHGELAPKFLEEAASAATSNDLRRVLKVVDRVLAGNVAGVARPSSQSFQAFAEEWTSGRLHERFPDQVKAKSSAKTDEQRLGAHVYPLVGHIPIGEFTIDHAEAVMRALDPELSSASRRHVAQLLTRILGLAHYPARVIAAHPLPRGFLPKLGGAKALTYLYPDEDTKLLRESKVPLGRRVLYGFLTREGARRSEAELLTWADVDLKRGALTLDTNKTDDPRAWAMDPGTVRGLVAWKKLLGGRAKPGSRVFVELTGEPIALERAAEQLREDLKTAGVNREVLFEKSKVRQPVRLHDLRATFVTLSLAAGKNEGWVMDRTGHTTSAMVHRYRRASRTVAELGLGSVLPLDEAIPELAVASAD